MPNNEHWRRLPRFYGDPAGLLVGAEALLAGMESTGQPAIRWSVSSQPALLLGSSQRVEEADFAACHERDVSVHKRRSGGTAVYADPGFLLLDVALPHAHPLLTANVTEAYRWLGEVWATALGDLGIDARTIDVDEAREHNATLDPEVRRACFGGISPYEVFVGERKIVGLAQIRRRVGGVLQAGIYLHWRPEQVSEVLSGDDVARERRSRLLAGRALGLRDVADPHIAFERVIAAWEEAVATMLGVELPDDAWLDEELAAAEALRGRYEPLRMDASDSGVTGHGLR